ncbi:putative TIR domain, P-loop containing nucleoside triphosphate hydrolase [Lupinus albus]|uniref:Putative TIR domain, P-loop containing nucleoside triphosphate hydrolase n=1 Tax=Lupinus albus TaxID=3870 RepID=A0A6A4QP79_LUPAL|nr:putative TIR domain, P-loop containing nucleoside triphosphate hydrolase [Lupinus albus]
MALSVSSPSTNSSPIRKWKYEVFLSFRGEDTRFGFTDHLYNGLKNKGIVTFRDNEGLERGDVISKELFKAIEESLCAVVILSQNYASSTWCLKELEKILESKNRLGQQVLPIFYGVEPSDIKDQKGSFSEAFKIHEIRFKDDKQKVQNWRDALTQVADLAGLSSINCYETELIEKIAETVSAKLLPRLSFSFDGLIGIGSKVAEMKSLLEMGLEDDVCFVGIWGMGGVGKTTLASVVYEGIRNEFEISCFVANVREVSEKFGLAHLQRELLSPLKHTNFQIKNETEGRDKIRHFLSHMKVLIVLDDVSDKRQLQYLVGKQEWFGKGSRVIITTRDKHLLTPKRLFKNYDIEMLNSDQSLKLLCLNAFHEDQPEAGYLDFT